VQFQTATGLSAALAARDLTLDLVKETVATRLAMFFDIAADLFRPAG
jgi:hypothetical protein